MSVAAVLGRAYAAGLALQAHGDRLRWRGPQPSADLLGELKVHKAELLVLLACTEPVPVTDTLAELRAACAARAAALIGAFDYPDVAADHAAVAAEWLLPAPGTPERDRLDTRKHNAAAGLLRAALQRLPRLP